MGYTFDISQYKEGRVDMSNAPSIIIKNCFQIDIDLEQFVENENPINMIASWDVSIIHVHLYTLSEEEAEPEEFESSDDHNDENQTACESLPLPHATLHTSWDNIILPPPIKSNLLGYAKSALLFSQAQVSPHIISWNRLILLHGPPGTGKTSLCRALAHKLAIRTQDIFNQGGFLLEIKSHSLFSKWFSESGKLISKLFLRIREMVQDEPDSLFCVLIDEVESLAASRVNGSSGGVEPSDAVRAVNSLLTSIDSLKAYRNVIVLSTTNITTSVDAAFVDRVDMKQYIGLPCLQARYEILRTCINELIRVGIISFEKEMNEDKKSDPPSSLVVPDFCDLQQIGGRREDLTGSLLLQCAESCEGLSGRTLRKLPFQSHAFFIRSNESVTISKFISALQDGIQREKTARKELDV
jgi:SpoVK/Ycf46/Vps4 family AAA+-type ATPase